MSASLQREDIRRIRVLEGGNYLLGRTSLRRRIVERLRRDNADLVNALGEEAAVGGDEQVDVSLRFRILSMQSATVFSDRNQGHHPGQHATATHRDRQVSTHQRGSH